MSSTDDRWGTSFNFLLPSGLVRETLQAYMGRMPQRSSLENHTERFQQMFKLRCILSWRSE